MYIKTKKNIGEIEKNRILEFLKNNKLGSLIIEDEETLKIGVLGDRSKVDMDRLLSFHGVDELVVIGKSYKFVSREFQKQDTVIDIKGRKIGGGNFMLMAGPCAIENKESVFQIAEQVKNQELKY